MATNRTFTMIKPDAVEANNIGPILAMINKAGFRIKAMKYLSLSKQQAGSFYEVHKERPFYGELVDYMSRFKLLVFYSLMYGLGGFVIAYYLADPSIGLSNELPQSDRYFGWFIYLFYAYSKRFSATPVFLFCFVNCYISLHDFR